MKNKDLFKFWDGVLSQKRKRLLKRMGKHKADKVGWNGVLCLDDSHSRGHWAAWVFFMLTLRANCCCFQVLLGVLFVYLVNLYCLIFFCVCRELLGFFSLDVYSRILKYHFKF